MVSPCIQQRQWMAAIYNSNNKDYDEQDELSRVMYNNNNNNGVNSDIDDPNDPRVMRRMRSRHHVTKKTLQYNKARTQVLKQQQASAAFDLPSPPVVKTIGGGTSMIFAMARRMWEQEKVDATEQNEKERSHSPPQQQKRNNGAATGAGAGAATGAATGWFPRWRPTSTQLSGISNFNPDFRTQAPEMNSQAFAGTIWRNVRKRNKPSLWRYALRTYDRMGNAPTVYSKRKHTSQQLQQHYVERTNEHYHGALLAAAKLGLWEKAFEIFREVEQRQQGSNRKPYASGVVGGNKHSQQSIYVTDDMVVSLIYACVRASRSMSSTRVSLAARRRPLDEACKVLDKITTDHGINIETRHCNPIAAAYLHLSLRNEAEGLVSRLKDRKIGPEPEDGVQIFNINDMGTKDKGSYTLLVSGAVQEEDWASAVDALRNMTDAGLYPNQRHLHAWNEVSERKTKHRTTRSWKKKRDELWIERSLR